MFIYNYISKTLFVHFFMNLHAAKALILCKYFYIINIILLLNHISSSVLSLHEYIMDIRLMDLEPQPPKHYRPGGNVICPHPTSKTIWILNQMCFSLFVLEGDQETNFTPDRLEWLEWHSRKAGY